MLGEKSICFCVYVCGKVVGGDVVSIVKAKVVAVSKRVHSEEQVEKRHNTVITYRGMNIEVSVQSLREEGDLRVKTL
eukprot:2654705-Amphidinium_carterae.1